MSAHRGRPSTFPFLGTTTEAAGLRSGELRRTSGW